MVSGGPWGGRPYPGESRMSNTITIVFVLTFPPHLHCHGLTPHPRLAHLPHMPTCQMEVVLLGVWKLPVSLSTSLVHKCETEVVSFVTPMPLSSVQYPCPQSRAEADTARHLCRTLMPPLPLCPHAPHSLWRCSHHHFSCIWHLHVYCHHLSTVLTSSDLQT